MRQTVKVEGLRELDAALGELPKATGKAVLRRTLLKATKPILDAARARAPKMTGQLKASHTAGTKLTRSQRRKLKKMPRATVEVYAGPGGLAQAIAQEFGTAHHKAQPFMQPAWDGQKMAALEIIKTELGNEIEKARKRLARKAARAANTPTVR